MKVYSIPALIIASICLTIAISDCLAWVRRDRKRSDIAFIMICLSGASFCLFCSGEYNVELPIQSIFWLKGEVVSSTIAGFSLLWFVAEKTRLVKRRYLVACLVWAALACLSQVLELGELTWIASRPFVLRVDLPFGWDFVYKEVERGPVLVAIAGVGFLFMAYLLLVVIKFRRLGNRKEALALFYALGFIIFAQILDFFIGIGIVHFVFVLEYAWLATILFVGLQRSNDFIEAALTRAALQKTDLELKESQATLSTIIDSTADMIWSVDAASFNLQSFNRGFRDYFAEYYGSAVSVGMSLEELCGSKDKAREWRAIYGQALRDGASSLEQSMPESSKIFSMRVNLLRREGKVFGLSVFGQDISERKKAEERIERALSEKEVLLQEVFHRTKNNMSVIISILRLQANQLGDQRLKDAFAVSIDRIISMSMVHDRLYQTEDLSRIDLKSYLKALADRLMANYASPANRPALVLDLESASVSLDAAINCGLIVNELLTNALKYAFPEGRRGEIRIVLKGEEEALRLTVSDDGEGPPPGFDPKRDGHLGLRLIHSLAQGKKWARLDFALDRGFACTLTFASGVGSRP